ncbi:MAG: DNA topoisomerase (ATP-hydrolyzing) subunit B [Salinivirgaceae bacterium]|nr:DNA topoisomerase (ATP-hydrolyzing) subunit B [Salinivirgaceae bacterium]
MSEEVKTQQNQEYGADSIQVLEGLEAVRKRPAMYIGDIGVKGLHHLVYEVVDNSIDEALAGFCNTIEVSINPDNSITVKDNGRGIPTDKMQKGGKSALEVVMTVLHAGGKFNKDTYKVSGGLHGVGVSCVNALSVMLRAEVHRDGQVFEQTFSKGTPTCEVHVIGQCADTGTIITFKPDGSIFADTVYQYNILAARMRELAYLNKGITISLSDLRPDEEGNTKTETFHSDEGLVEFVKYLDTNRTPIIEGFQPISIVNTKGEVPVEIAMTYNNGYSESVLSYVNNIHTIEGGTHLTGFRTALTRVLKKYADENMSRELEKAKVEVTGDDFREGLTAVISVKVAEPQFEGQTKTKLGNGEVSGIVNQAVGEALSMYLEEHPSEAKVIVGKVILAAQARMAAQKARASVRVKSPLSGGGMPGKLTDCSDKDPAVRELFLVEGDSAGGTAKQARDRHFQAILPLRGKILNVEKAIRHRVFDSEEVRNIYTALGVKIDVNGNLDLSGVRYHKVIIMTDADVDGSHIATLIMTLFFRYMREVIECGYLYIATPPLYLVKKGNQQRYCWDEMQRRQAIDEMGGGDENKVHVQRYKGLGEMNEIQLRDTTMSPENRTLRQVTIENAAEADYIFSMLMGDDVPLRRDFIEKNAKYANIDA